MALGIGAGDEVITVPYTWISTAEVISLLGVKNLYLWMFVMTLGIWMRSSLRLPLPIRPKQSCQFPYTDNARTWILSTRSQRNTTYLLSKMRLQSFGATYKGKKFAIYQPSAVPHFSFQTSWVLWGWGCLIHK